MQECKSVETILRQHFKLSVSQSPQTEFERFEMAKVSYASGTGSMMYGMVCSRPDLAFAVSVVSRFMSNPGRTHWEALQWVLRYIKGIVKVGILFSGSNEGVAEVLNGYVDSDFAGSIDTRKSVT